MQCAPQVRDDEPGPLVEAHGHPLQEHDGEVGVKLNPRGQERGKGGELAGAQDADLLVDDGKDRVDDLHLGVHDVGVEEQGQQGGAVQRGQGSPGFVLKEDFVFFSSFGYATVLLVFLRSSLPKQ